MKTINLKKLIIVILALVMTVCVAAVAGMNLIFASADQRAVTISGSTIFYTSGGAQVWSHKTDDEQYYTMFVFTEEDNSVNYRRDLAYRWYYDENEGEEDAEVSVKAGLFNMEIGFESLGFEKFVITFESQQYAQTKDSKTVNYIMFAPDGDDVRVFVTDDVDASVPDDAAKVSADNISIAFAENEVGGSFDITVNGEKVGVFSNVGGNYSKYVSSTTKPVIPLAFNAVFAADGEEEGGNAYMILYSLNGQSFELTETPAYSTDHYVSGKVYDNAAPVLCLVDGLNFVGLGEEIGFSYAVIDVLASAPSETYSYFMLTNEQAGNADFNADEYTNEELYRTVTDSDNQYMIPHADSYLPTEENYNSDVFDGENVKAEAAVKVAVKLTDTTAAGGISTYVLLDWYISEDYLINVNGNSYIAVANDGIGAVYAYTDVSSGVSDTDSEEWQNLLAAYQEAVDNAAKDLRAGSNNYFYLPSAESLFADNCTAYEDLVFSIYYNNGSQQSTTSLSASSLSINLTTAGKYVFTVYVTDLAGNPMYYFDAEKDEDDAKTEISTSDIWSMYTEEEDSDYENTRRYLPWFTFTVNASDLEIEDPEEQEIAYIDTTFSDISFDINGVEYSDTYTLYEFDNERFAAEKNDGELLTYDQFLARKTELMDWDTHPDYRAYFTKIYSVNDSVMASNTEEYPIYKDYAWNDSSLTFVPQKATFYIVKCKVESKAVGNSRPAAVAYLVVSASERVDPIVGEDTWIQDNLVSIILLAIAGAALIGIILLIVIKPKDKVDIDEIELTDTSKAKKKSAKKNKS